MLSQFAVRNTDNERCRSRSSVSGEAVGGIDDMGSLNCWEFKKCGREPGGLKAQDLGVCPAANTTSVHGVNGGKNGGRACWALAGTLCGGVVQGTFAAKCANCLKCEFFLLVKGEEGKALLSASQILEKLKAA